MSESIVRSVAETTPTESELCSSNGLPIAATGVPTTTEDEVPRGTGASGWARRIDADDRHVAEQIPADDPSPAPDRDP